MFDPQWQTNTPMRGGSPVTSRSGGYSGLLVSVKRAAPSRAAAAPAAVNARPAGLDRVELRGVAEAVLVQLDAQPARQLAHRLADLHPDRQHDQVEALVEQAAVLVLVVNDQVVGIRVFA
jgi:hypothetical protein